MKKSYLRLLVAVLLLTLPLLAACTTAEETPPGETPAVEEPAAEEPAAEEPAAEEPAAEEPVASGPPAIPHDLAGRDDCLMCHQTGVGGAPQYPANHAGRTSDTCRACHQPAS